MVHENERLNGRRDSLKFTLQPFSLNPGKITPGRVEQKHGPLLPFEGLVEFGLFWMKMFLEGKSPGHDGRIIMVTRNDIPWDSRGLDLFPDPSVRLRVPFLKAEVSGDDQGIGLMGKPFPKAVQKIRPNVDSPGRFFRRADVDIADLQNFFQTRFSGSCVDSAGHSFE